MKEKISNFLKVFLLFTAMTFGFYFIYCFIWWSIGFPLVDWSMWLLGGLAGITEFGYYLWLRG